MDPTVQNNAKMYFHGKLILDAMKTLRDNYNFDKATDVVISGGSAGRLNTFVHTNYIGIQFVVVHVSLKTSEGVFDIG